MVHCSRADTKDCDDRGEKLHRKTKEEGGYRLVRAIRPCWCAQGSDKDHLKCHAKT